MKLKFTTLPAYFFILLVIPIQAQRKEARWVSIDSYEKLLEFKQSGYTHIQQGVTIRDDKLSEENVDAFHDLLYDALNKLKEVKGGVYLDFSTYGLNKVRFNQLEYIGGKLEVINVERIVFNSLKTIGSDFVITESNEIKELRVPRLEQINGELSITNGPVNLKLPRLEYLEGSYSTYDSPNTQHVSLPRLIDVSGGLHLGNESVPLRSVNLSNLEDVGLSFILNTDLTNVHNISVSSLENVRYNLKISGFLPSLKNLKNVGRDFEINLATGIRDLSINLPSLQQIEEDFRIKGPFENSVKEVLVPSLLNVEYFNGTSESEIVLDRLYAPSLQSVFSISFRTRTFDLTGLQESTYWLSLKDLDPSKEILFPNLKKASNFFLSSWNNERFPLISAPELITTFHLPKYARGLVYSKLIEANDLEFSFEGDMSVIDFAAIKKLEYLSLKNGNFPSVDFSSLTSIEGISINNVPALELKMPSLQKIESFGARKTDLQDFELHPVDIQSIGIHDSFIDSDFLSNLSYCESLSLREITIENELDLHNLGTLSELWINLQVPNSVNLSALKHVSKGLPSFRLSGITHLDLKSLQRIKELDLTSGELEEVNLSSLQEVEELEITSNFISTVSLPQLSSARSVGIEGGNINAIDLASLSHVGNLSVRNTNVFDLDLSSVSTAGDITITSAQILKSINLSNLPKMDNLILSNLPSLQTFITTKPGQEAGLIAHPRVSSSVGTFEEIELECKNGDKKTTFNPLFTIKSIECKSIENEYGTTSEIPVISQINLVSPEGAQSTYKGEYLYSLIRPSQGNIDFQTIDNEVSSITKTLTIYNSGNSEANITLSIDESNTNVASSSRISSVSSYSVNKGQLELGPSSDEIINITYTPNSPGESEAILTLQNGNEERLIKLTGARKEELYLGEIPIKAETIRKESDQVYILLGDVVIGGMLTAEGEIFLDLNQSKIYGNAILSTSHLPRLRRRIGLFRGTFELKLKDGKLTTDFAEGTNLFELAEIPVLATSLEFRTDSLIMSATMTLPDDFGDRELGIEKIYITKDNGIDVKGTFPLPGKVKLGSVEFDDFFLTFDTSQDELGGGGELETELFEVGAEINLQRGKLKDLSLSYQDPVRLGFTGWSMIDLTGAVKNLNKETPELNLKTSLTPTFIESFPLIQIDDLGLSYLFGERLTGSGRLALFDQTLADARIDIEKSRISSSGRVNFANILKGEIGFSIGYLIKQFIQLAEENDP